MVTMNRSIFVTLLAGLSIAAGSAGAQEGDGTLAYEGFPYVSHFVALDGGLRMHYLDEGRGDPILLLHGIPTQAYLWRNMIPILSEHGRVIAPDMINFGLSDRTEPLDAAGHIEMLTQFIEALGLDDITLVLHDWGGPWGFAYAANHPDRVRGLVFFETPFQPIPDMSNVPSFFLTGVLHPVTGRKNVVDDNFFVECFLLNPECGGTRRQWTEQERAVYRAPFLTPESREQLFLLPQYLPFLDTTGHPRYDPDGSGGQPAKPAPQIEIAQRSAAYLMRTETPKLFIHGVPGRLPNAATLAAQLAHVMPNLETRSVGSESAPAYHFIQEDAPVELAETIADFIALL